MAVQKQVGRDEVEGSEGSPGGEENGWLFRRRGRVISLGEFKDRKGWG